MEILSEVMLTTDYITRVVGFYNVLRISPHNTVTHVCNENWNIFNGNI